jgi:hypothetical protein
MIYTRDLGPGPQEPANKLNDNWLELVSSLAFQCPECPTYNCCR